MNNIPSEKQEYSKMISNVLYKTHQRSTSSNELFKILSLPRNIHLYYIHSKTDWFFWNNLKYILSETEDYHGTTIDVHLRYIYHIHSNANFILKLSVNFEKKAYLAYRTSTVSKFTFSLINNKNHFLRLSSAIYDDTRNTINRKKLYLKNNV